ncbi:twin-arginine translocase TatA/TatE family subunit [Sphingomonas sp.]|uniref:twin-arginine translocase TatA/TatE family subunit n=1 Tax=Sphingomonas sp. TaxID=28214 RepID=UPI00286D477A|nr:twin-arginine translocase TatA/TatE family subunit [Sphingomonas sp.]
MGGFSLWHILILAILVLLLFGGSRFSNMMGDIAKGMKSFKQGLSDDDEAKNRQPVPPPQQLPPQAQAPQPPIDITPRAADPVAPPPPVDDQAR